MATINTPENVDKIAKAFLEVLLSWFKEVGAYAEDESEPSYRVPCEKLTKKLVENANDHFDANMAMDEAFTKCGLKALPEDGQMSQDTCDLWNAAWEKAAQLADAARAA